MPNNLPNQLAPQSLTSDRQPLDRFSRQLPPEDATGADFMRLFVLGDRTDQVPQCCLLIMPGGVGYTSAMYLGRQWALTAGHAVGLRGEYVLGLPVEGVGDRTDANSFTVTITKNPSADIALLHLAGDPGLDGIPLASAEELRQADSVQLCGFGPDRCNAAQDSGFRRLSDPFPIAKDSAEGVFMVSNSAAYLSCPGDSGGGALIRMDDDTFKLAGIIVDGPHSPAGRPIGSKCVRLPAYYDWIHRVTGLPVPA